MPTNKKKLVRERMAKTGEGYATALKAIRKETKPHVQQKHVRTEPKPP